MSTDEHPSGSGAEQYTNDLRDALAALREDIDVLTGRADASDARERVALDRANASENRQDLADDRADASEAREQTATDRVDALEAVVTKDELRIDDLEAHVDIDRQLILELRDTGLLAQDQVDQLQTALRTSRMIGQAIGLLMAEGSLTEEQAFAALRQASNHTNRKLRDIAEEVVATGTTAAIT